MHKMTYQFGRRRQVFTATENGWFPWLVLYVIQRAALLSHVLKMAETQTLILPNPTLSLQPKKRKKY